MELRRLAGKHCTDRNHSKQSHCRRDCSGDPRRRGLEPGGRRTSHDLRPPSLVTGGEPGCHLHRRRPPAPRAAREQARNRAPPAVRLRRPPRPGVGPGGPPHSGESRVTGILAGRWPELPPHRRSFGRRFALRGLSEHGKNKPFWPVLAWRPKLVHPICGVGAQDEPDIVSTNRGYRCDRGDCAVLLDLTDPSLDQRIDRNQGVHQVLDQVPELAPGLFELTRRHCGGSGADS